MQRSLIRFPAWCRVFVALGICLALVAADKPARSLRVESVLVTLIEQVEVPAREAGALAEVAVREGQIVAPGDLLARIEDDEIRLVLQQSELEWDIARKQVENDVKVRYAKKAQEVAHAELERALEANRRYKKSIAQSELDHLRLVAQRSELEVEQATHDQEVATLASRLKENQRDQVAHEVERRQIVAPLGGMIAQVKRRKGEWVEPKDAVVRILRIDRLRAEGFVNSRDLTSDLSGASVTLTVDVPGRAQTTFKGALVFISPEINPVNGQVRVWAEIENTDLLLRPGMQGSLAIDLAGPAAGAEAASP